MAFRVSTIETYITDQKYGDSDVLAIMTRAHAAAKKFDDGGDLFSATDLEKVLGSEERAKQFLEAREHNLERYR